VGRGEENVLERPVPVRTSPWYLRFESQRAYNVMIMLLRLFDTKGRDAEAENGRED
jgi:hypothetical protein